MYRLKKAFGLIIILLSLCVILLINVTVFRQIPDVLEFHYQNTSVPQMTIKEMEQFKVDNEILVAYSGVEQQSISTFSGNNEDVAAVYTDKFYNELYPIQMLHGNFFVGENEIVISQYLAESLFLTDNAVGNAVTLGAKDYCISGIYKEDKSIMAQSFGTPRVFAPIKADMPLNLISFIGSNTAGYYISLFSKDTAYKMSGYFPVSILQEANFLKLLNRVLMLVISIIFITKMVKYSLASYRKMRISIKASLTEKYVLSALKCNWKSVGGFLFPAIICILAISVALFALAMPISLPIDMIVENVFDLSAYYDILAGRLALTNTFICPQAAFYLKYSQVSVMIYLLAFMGIWIGILIECITKKE